jgi:NAD-dependent DNA ligase/predicted flap endonuclease-1-like 5' DNA nuclease
MLGANVNKKGKIEKNQKIREGPCIFPFKHQWKEHNECIDNKDKGKICATSVTERGTLKTYGYCTPEQPDRNTHSISKSNNNRVKKGTKKKAPRKKRTLKIVERFPSRSKSRSKSKSATVSPKIQVIGEAVKDKDIKILSKSKSMSKSKSKSMSKSMNNELIDIMDELADIMLRQGEPFKARAYKRASETIMSFPEDIVNVDQLEGKPAIGKTIMEKMIEFQKTGTLRVLERERKNPLNIFTNIYGVGPKKAKQLIEDGITTLTLLKENESKLNDTQKVGLQYYEPLQKRIPRNEIEEFAKVFDTIFKQVAPEGSKYEIVGSYRREAQNSGDIDIIVTNADNNIAAFNTFLDKLIAEDIIIEVLTRGKTKSLTIGKLATNGSIARRIDFLYTEPKEYAFATLYFTGSKAFNTVMRQRAIDLGYTLNEHGLSSMVSGKKGERLTNDFPTEQSIFDFLGMKYKEPKEREGYKSVELLDDQTQPSVEIVQKKDTATQKSKHTNYKEDIMAFKKEGLDALFMLNEKQLATILDEAQKAYYNDSENVLMTDNEFDIIKEYMEKKYPKNKILEQIGAPIQEKNKVSLPYNMPSMDKIKPDTTALTKWKAKYSGPYVLSAKLDGISAMYSSENNEQKLYTRGNGKVGQDISHLIPYLRLPNTKDITIRGELIMKKTTFLEKYASEFSNSRNLVAGIVNQKKIEADKFKDVDFVAYEVIKPTLKPSEQMTFLGKENVDEVINETKTSIDNTLLSTILVDWRKNYEYTIDGVIVTNDEIYDRTDKNPEHGFAFKMVLSDQLAEAKVLNVLWSPSKDGYLKPRIQIEPVVLGGAKIEYATAFNAAFVEENKLGIGALVKLVRSGDVIPHIMAVIEPAEKAKMPDVAYKWNDTHVDIIMDDAEQDETVKEKNIVGFFKGLEVDGLGPGNVKKIMKAGYDTVPKIIAMSEEDYLKVDGFKKKMAEKVFNSIHNKIAAAPLAKIMAVSNIFGRGFGERRIEPILANYPDMLKNTTTSSDEDKIQQIKSIRGMEKKTAERFVKNLPKFLEFITVAKLETKLNDGSKEDAQPKDDSHPLYDKSIIITGFRNKELSAELKRVGARESSAVSKNTFAVIVKSNDEEETGKVGAAKQKNIPIYTIEEFKEKFGLSFE